MKHALVYVYDPSEAGPTEEELSDWLAVDKEMKDAGVFVYAEGLHAVETAKTLSIRDGKESIDDGAATSGDAIAGFIVLDVADLDAALEWARKVPTANYGKVEVRPVVEFEG